MVLKYKILNQFNRTVLLINYMKLLIWLYCFCASKPDDFFLSLRKWAHTEGTTSECCETLNIIQHWKQVGQTKWLATITAQQTVTNKKSYTYNTNIKMVRYTCKKIYKICIHYKHIYWILNRKRNWINVYIGLQKAHNQPLYMIFFLLFLMLISK